MQTLFHFSEVVVMVRHWYEVGTGHEEHGARIDLRTVTPIVMRGSRSVAQPILIDGIFWRADLFDTVGLPKGNGRSAHFHPRFPGMEPEYGNFDDALNADPHGWAARQLEDITAMAETAGVRLADPERSAAEVRAGLPVIMAAVESYGARSCVSPEWCRSMTTDTGYVIDGQVADYRGGEGGDPRCQPEAAAAWAV
ncbi:MAG: hypothetical protein QM626_08715 [Microbacterium sp.]|uniref:hypothetical protein n=1 Tax=Microbacterium sp. TaxID=51671 RepID=UPI0039E3DF74